MFYSTSSFRGVSKECTREAQYLLKLYEDASDLLERPTGKNSAATRHTSHLQRCQALRWAGLFELYRRVLAAPLPLRLAPWTMAATAPALNECGILIGEPTATAQGNEWLARGMGPTLFPQGAIPMKRILFENGVNNHILASKYYALAHRAHRVEGPPCWLISITLEPGDLIESLFDGSAQTNPDTDTLAFTEALAPQNYPGITAVARRIVPEIGSRLLQSGYTALSNKRS